MLPGTIQVINGHVAFARQYSMYMLAVRTAPYKSKKWMIFLSRLMHLPMQTCTQDISCFTGSQAEPVLEISGSGG